MFCAMRNAKQKKTVPAKNSEAIFWRPRFTRPLRAGERANANFACSEGFFCTRRAAPSAGLVVFARPAVLAAAFVPGVPARVPCCSPGGCACALPQVGLRSASLFPARVPCCLLLLRLACAASCCFCLCPVLPGPACWKCARVLPCAAFFSYLSPFPASLLSLKILFTCRSGRDGPLLSSEKKVDKDSRGALPLRTPFLRPAANLLFFRAAGRLTRPLGPQTAG